MSRLGLANKLKRLLDFKTKTASWSFLRKFTVPILLIAAIVVGLAWYAELSYKRFEVADSRYHKTTELAAMLIHFDEVLTMSANMAASTGDMVWEDRYRQAEPQVDGAIKELIEISAGFGGEEDSAYITSTANAELVEMENKAFDLTRHGNRQAALSLLASGEYERQKKLYKEGIAKVSAAADKVMKSQVQKRRLIAMVSMLFVCAVASLAVFGWFAAVGFSRQVKKRKRVSVQLDASNQHLRATEQQLRAANQQLRATEQQLHATEQQLKAANQQLTAANQQLTASNEQLSMNQQHIEQLNVELRTSAEQANLMAREATQANEAKSRFLANLSHEIRTPMNAIVGFSDVLGDEEMTEQQKDYVNLISQSAQHLLELINGMLDFSKMESGKLKTEMSDYSLAELFNSVSSLMLPAAEKKHLNFEIVRSNDLPEHIITDGGRLRQCLINLVGNAIKFTDKGSVTMEVALDDSGEDSFIRFDIEDTGIGIAVEKQEQIFECFEQVDSTASRQYGGAGLGLAVVKQLAELLGGSLSLSSEAGKGSVFSLVIPTNLKVKSQPSLEAGGVDIEMSPENLLQARFSGSVLVAEDILTNQLLIQHLLEKMGFEVTMVDDGNKVVQKAMSRNYDLIFMDMQMPNMNGYDATRMLRDKSIDTPIIALTANAMAGDEGKCICAGCDDYLAKPIDRLRLIKKILKYIRPAGTAETIDVIRQQVDGLSDLCSSESPGGGLSETSKCETARQNTSTKQS